jgi:hypothetical protein
MLEKSEGSTVEQAIDATGVGSEECLSEERLSFVVGVQQLRNLISH